MIEVGVARQMPYRISFLLVYRRIIDIWSLFFFCLCSFPIVCFSSFFFSGSFGGKRDLYHTDSNGNNDYDMGYENTPMMLPIDVG